MKRTRRAYLVTVVWPEGKETTIEVRAIDYMEAEKIVRRADPGGISYRAVLKEARP